MTGRGRDDFAWQKHANCADININPTIFSVPERATEALKVCKNCPVQEPCEQLGKGNVGVWGGKAKYPRAGRPRRGLTLTDDDASMTLVECRRCDEPWLVHTLSPKLFRTIATFCPACIPVIYPAVAW